jgi:hypothetical protein
MKNIKLQDFVTKTAARSQITFGDVRRLQRDHLPDGVSTREEAEILIRLDAKVGRADKTWTDWLVAAIVDFAILNERPIGALESGTGEWLKALLAVTGTSTKAGRRIAREIRREAVRVQSTISSMAEEDENAMLPLPSEAVEGTMNAFQLAA